MSALAPVVKEDVIILDVENVADSDYIPINLAEQFPNLEFIKAERCSIRGLAVATLAGLTKIRFIDLDYNKIQTLTAEMFQGLTTLERIDMGESKFAEELTISIL